MTRRTSRTTYPAPPIGGIIRYAYLWRDQYRAGVTEGKERPVMVMASRAAPDGRLTVWVAPISSSPRRNDGFVVLGPTTCTSTGLKPPAYLVVDEVNQFTWPGPDVRLAVDTDPPSPLQGMAAIGDRHAATTLMIQYGASGRLRTVVRTDAPPRQPPRSRRAQT